MCKGPNEPGGPHRCGGHARTAYQEAASASAQARMTERAANAERDAAEAAYVDSNDASVNILRDALRETDPEKTKALNEELAAEQRVEAKLKRDKERAESAHDVAKRTQRAAELRESEALYAYDATTEGLLSLTNEFNRRDAAWQASITASSQTGVGNELTAEQTAELGELHGLARRRENAERRMATEAADRNGALVDSAESYQESEELDQAHGEHKEASQIIADGDASPEKVEAAKEQLAQAQAAIDAARKRDRTRSMLRPYRAADPGTYGMLEEPAWKGVSSAHRTVVGTDGEPKEQIILQREVDGVRTQKVFETDAAAIHEKRRYLRESNAPDAADRASRYPTTAEVLRGLGQDFGKLNAKGGTWANVKANGGTREEYERGMTAQRVLSGLFAPAAESRVEERELVDA